MAKLTDGKLTSGAQAVAVHAVPTVPRPREDRAGPCAQVGVKLLYSAFLRRPQGPPYPPLYNLPPQKKKKKKCAGHFVFMRAAEMSIA